IITDTEEAAKAKHGVRDFSAHLVDHDALDRTDLLIIGAIDGGAFNLVTSDEIRRFTFFGDHVSPPLSCLAENAAGSERVPRDPQGQTVFNNHVRAFGALDAGSKLCIQPAHRTTDLALAAEYVTGSAVVSVISCV